MNHIAKFWPLSDIHLAGRNSSSPVFSSKPLYRLAVEALARSYSNNPRCPHYRAAIEQLPLGSRLDLLAEMCDYPSLVEVQWQILSDPLLVSDFIKYLSSDLTPLVQCLQWLQSVKKPIPIQLFRQYKKLIEKKIWTGGVPRLDYRCGLRIGTFLTETGWTVEAIGILQLAQQHASFGTAEELAVLRQLMRAQTLAGKLINAGKTYDRMKRMLSNVIRQCAISQALSDKRSNGQSLQDLQMAVFHSFSLYHYEELNFELSYEYGMHSLARISARSPSRLVIDVLRQLVRACLGRRMHAKAAYILRQAIGLVVQHYGRVSALYAETLEDLALLLLVCNHVGESVDVYAEAQLLYMQLYGSRNLMLSLAQGNLAYGLCLQAYVTGRRDRALQHVAKSIGNYQRIWPPEHRMLAQVFRLRSTMELFTFSNATGEEPGFLQDELFNPQDIEPLSVKDLSAHLRVIEQWEKK
uniref:Anaphase-promoting complex subunit 5 n=1 Tax=Anopheles stephensi TaxID=30069 RepID=A0A182YF59_ANOST